MKRIITKIYCKESTNKFCKCVYITSKDEEGNNEENRVFFESVEVDESKLQIIYFDQTTTNMIQGLKGIFARKPLISIGI